MVFIPNKLKAITFSKRPVGNKILALLYTALFVLIPAWLILWLYVNPAAFAVSPEIVALFEDYDAGLVVMAVLLFAIAGNGLTLQYFPTRMHKAVLAFVPLVVNFLIIFTLNQFGSIRLSLLMMGLVNYLAFIAFALWTWIKVAIYEPGASWKQHTKKSIQGIVGSLFFTGVFGYFLVISYRLGFEIFLQDVEGFWYWAAFVYFVFAIYSVISQMPEVTAHQQQLRIQEAVARTYRSTGRRGPAFPKDVRWPSDKK